MQPFVFLLTISAMLGHAVLGCHWHHAHAGQTEHAAVANQTGTDECHAHCRCARAGDESAGGHEEKHPQDECGEETCTSLIPAKVKLPVSDQVAWTELLPPAQTPPAILGVRSFWSDVDHVSFWGDLTPLRLRALTQVWVL